MSRAAAALGATLSLALCACSIDVPPFVVQPPTSGADGGAPSTPDGGLYVLYASPSSGSDLGGTGVVIGGGGFDPHATVSFGTLEATSATVLDSQSIVAITPPSPAGGVDVAVQNPDGGTAVLPGGYDFVSQ